MGMPTKLFSSIFLHSLAFDPNNSNRKQEKNQATIWKLKVDDNKDEDDGSSSHLPPPQPNSLFFGEGGGGGGACCSPRYRCSQNQLAARKLRSWCCSRSRGERKRNNVGSGIQHGYVYLNHDRPSPFDRIRRLSAHLRRLEPQPTTQVCALNSRGVKKIYGRVVLLIVGLFMFCLFPIDLDIFFTNKISVISTI